LVLTFVASPAGPARTNLAWSGGTTTRSPRTLPRIRSGLTYAKGSNSASSGPMLAYRWWSTGSAL